MLKMLYWMQKIVNILLRFEKFLGFEDGRSAEGSAPATLFPPAGDGPDLSLTRRLLPSGHAAHRHGWKVFSRALSGAGQGLGALGRHADVSAVASSDG